MSDNELQQENISIKANDEFIPKSKLDQLELEFSEQRGRFMSILVEKEQESASSKEDYIKILRELEDLRHAVVLSESTHREELNRNNAFYNNKINSLNKIIEDKTNENRELHKTFKSQSFSEPSKVLKNAVTTIPKKNCKNQEEQQLEEFMKQAQLESDALRSVLQPLEAELADLKATNKIVEQNCAIFQRMWMLATRNHLNWRAEKINFLLKIVDFLSVEQRQSIRAMLIHSTNYVSPHSDAVNFSYHNLTVEREQLLRICGLDNENCCLFTSYKRDGNMSAPLHRSPDVRQSNINSPTKSKNFKQLKRSLSEQVIFRNVFLSKDHCQESKNLSREDLLAIFDDNLKEMKSVTNFQAATALPNGNNSTNRVLSEREWSKLTAELTELRRFKNRVKIRTVEMKDNRDNLLPCQLCQNYEIQLQKIQENNQHLESVKFELQSLLEKSRKNLADSEQNLLDYENHLKCQTQQHNLLIKELEVKITTLEAEFENATSKWKAYVQLANDEISKLKSCLKTVQDEYQNFVKDCHLSTVEQLSAEKIEMPSEMEDLQFYALDLHEKYIASRVKSDQCAQNFLLEQEKLVKLKETNQILLKEKLVFETQQNEYQENLNRLNVELAELKNKKIQEQCSEQLNEYKIKYQNLKNELENSESVQKDFVVLSQKLQIQLEQLRESEGSDVRWQHEMDVYNCCECQRVFESSNMKLNSRSSKTLTSCKLHCRHCGKIFCQDCLCHTIYSGPNKRASRVCSVCHTLLNKNAIPYFSTINSQT